MSSFKKMTSLNKLKNSYLNIPFNFFNFSSIVSSFSTSTFAVTLLVEKDFGEEIKSISPGTEAEDTPNQEKPEDEEKPKEEIAEDEMPVEVPEEAPAPVDVIVQPV